MIYKKSLVLCLVFFVMLMGITSCNKNINLQDIQDGTQHVESIMNSKNISETVANISHAASDINGKIKTAVPKKAESQ